MISNQKFEELLCIKQDFRVLYFCSNFVIAVHLLSATEVDYIIGQVSTEDSGEPRRLIPCFRFTIVSSLTK